LRPIASRFGFIIQSIIDVNVNRIQSSNIIFIPVLKLSNLIQSNKTVSTTIFVSNKDDDDNEGTVIGSRIGIGICLIFLIFVNGFWCYKKTSFKKKENKIEELNLYFFLILNFFNTNKIHIINANNLSLPNKCISCVVSYVGQMFIWHKIN